MEIDLTSLKLLFIFVTDNNNVYDNTATDEVEQPQKHDPKKMLNISKSSQQMVLTSINSMNSSACMC